MMFVGKRLLAWQTSLSGTVCWCWVVALLFVAQLAQLAHLVVLDRLIGNYRLSSLTQMKSFEQLIVLMGNLIAQIASEMVQIVSTGRYDDFLDADVWQSWRGDIVTTLLDAWSLVLHDPLMESSRHSHSGGGRSVVGQQLKTALQEVSDK